MPNLKLQVFIYVGIGHSSIEQVCFERYTRLIQEKDENKDTNYVHESK